MDVYVRGGTAKAVGASMGCELEAGAHHCGHQAGVPLPPVRAGDATVSSAGWF